TGCLSNEYRIPGDELQRLAQTPPAIRGHHVHIVQSLGDRRSDPIPYRAPPPPPPEMPAPEPDQAPPPPDGADWSPDQGDGPIADDGWNDDGSGQININVDGSSAGPRHVHHGPPPRGRFGGDGMRGNPPSGWRGSPPQTGGVRGNPPSGWRGSPPGGGHGGGVAHGG